MPRSHSTSQKLLPLLLDSLKDYALFMMDPQGLIVTWTPGVLRVLGYEESEFLGRNADLIFTIQDRENGVPKSELQRAKQLGRCEDVRWHLRKDGSEFWANGEMIALRNDEGELRGFAKILRDDTPRKKLEDELRDARSRLESAMSAGSVGTWDFDIVGNRIFADKNMARLFGVSPEDASGGPLEHYARAMHPDDVERVSARIAQVIESGEPYESEYRVVHDDDSIRWISTRGKVEWDDTGRALRLPGVALDITRRKEAEEAMRRSEERYRTLFEAIDNGFCVIEMIYDDAGQPIDYRFIEVNPGFEKQTGLRDAAGKTILELAPDINRSWFPIYGRVALTGESTHFENFDDALGRWFDVHAFRIGVPENRHVAVLFTDITQRKGGEDALRQAHAQSEEANRIKDEFLATLSHELRTPLNAILGWSNLLRTNELDLETQQKGLETIERNSVAQAQLINDLLDVSRILTGKMRLELRPVELAEVVENAVRNSLPAAQVKDIQLETIIDHSTGLISGDLDRLGQVLWNLLSNSIKFTPRGGRISVRMARVESQVQVEISDNGKGIDPSFLPFVFERFRQADASSTRSYGGLGIGLALVRHLTEAHGGVVRVDSPGEGHGSTFTVTFPLKALRAQTVDVEPLAPPNASAGRTFAAPRSQIALPPLSGLRILVVDDEPDAREMVQLALKQRGASVEVADNAKSAFAQVMRNHENQQPFDVLVSDVGMPEEDGYSLLRRIRGQEQKMGGFLPAIALTAYASHKDRMTALLAGFQVHLPKPVDQMELVATIASLKGRTGHDE